MLSPEESSRTQSATFKCHVFSSLQQNLSIIQLKTDKDKNPSQLMNEPTLSAQHDREDFDEPESLCWKDDTGVAALCNQYSDNGAVAGVI